MVILPYAESLIFRRGPMVVLHRGPCAEDVSSGVQCPTFSPSRAIEIPCQRATGKMSSARGHAAAVVADAVDRASVIVRHQQRAVLEHLHVHRAADIV